MTGRRENNGRYTKAAWNVPSPHSTETHTCSHQHFRIYVHNFCCCCFSLTIELRVGKKKSVSPFSFAWHWDPFRIPNGTLKIARSLRFLFHECQLYCSLTLPCSHVPVIFLRLFLFRLLEPHLHFLYEFHMSVDTCAAVIASNRFQNQTTRPTNNSTHTLTHNTHKWAQIGSLNKI